MLPVTYPVAQKTLSCAKIKRCGLSKGGTDCEKVCHTVSQNAFCSDFDRAARTHAAVSASPATSHPDSKGCLHYVDETHWTT